MEGGGEKAYNTNTILLFICLLLYFSAGEIKFGASHMLGKFIPKELPSTIFSLLIISVARSFIIHSYNFQEFHTLAIIKGASRKLSQLLIQ